MVRLNFGLIRKIPMSRTPSWSNIRWETERQTSKFANAYDMGIIIVEYLREKLSPSQLQENKSMVTLEGDQGGFYIREPDCDIRLYCQGIPEKYWNELIAPELQNFADRFGCTLHIQDLIGGYVVTFFRDTRSLLCK